MGKSRKIISSFSKLFVCVLALVFAFSSSSFSQTSSKQKKEQLQQQMKKLQDEIKLIQGALNANNAKKVKNESEILALQAKIKSREKLIGNINDQIGDLDETIDKTQDEIERKTDEVEKMKTEYARLLRKSYENITLQNETVFLLSSSSFFEAIQRYNYLLKIAEYRKNQAKNIQKMVNELVAKKEDLQDTKEKKENLLKTETAQKAEMEKEKKEKDEAVAKLLEKNKKYRKQIDEKNRAMQQLNNRIQAIIEDEIRQAKKKAEELAKKNGNNTTNVIVKKGTNETMPLTPEEQALSKNFLENKGKLPWPVTKGYVVSQFGKHEHPVIKGVMVENSGVDIKTEAGTDARAVFGGTVVSIFFLPTLQNCVLIKHGEYFTVYSNIETVNVKANQTITTKQSLGKLHTDKTEELTKVHLEIWKGKDKMDPENWLAN